MNSKLVLLGAFLVALFILPAGIRAQEKPNILFIAVDDLKPLLGAYGDTIAVTPNIDDLASRGMYFSNAHCQQAVCGPSRASLMTSRYPDQTEVWDLNTLMRDRDPGIVTLPQHLITRGYNTLGTGKIFDSRSVTDFDPPSWSTTFRPHWNKKYYYNEIKPVGYSYASQEARDTIAILEAEASRLGVNVMEYVFSYYKPSWENTDVHIDAYGDGAVKNVGLELMQEAAGGSKPFFLAVGFSRPHLPFCAPTEFFDLYDPEDIPLAPFRQQATNSPSLAYHNWDELRAYTDIPEEGNMDDLQQRELIHAYYAATSYIDHLVGLLITELEVLGLDENTIIVLWGDHGWHLGDHDLWCKHSNFEQATRVPLVIYDPRRDHLAHSSSSPVEFTDIAPTLLDLAGQGIPAYFEGLSLAPILADSSSSVRETALSQYPRNGKMGYTVRTDRYRYTRWENTDGSLNAAELYDYETDPLETISLVNDQAYASIAERLDSIAAERARIPSTQHRLLVQVQEEGSQGGTLNIQDALVTLAGESLQSDASGSVFFTHIDGKHQVRVEHELFEPLDTLIDLYGDLELVLSLERRTPVYTLQLDISDLHKARNLKNVSISLEAKQGATGGYTGFTDSNGETSLEVEEGSYLLTLEKSYYEALQSDLEITGNLEVSYRMAATHANLKFLLNDNGTPVNNAKVIIGTDTLLTGSIGLAAFEWLPTGVSYDYEIIKEQYKEQSGQIYLLADSTLDVQLEKLTGLPYSQAADLLSIGPNPAGETLAVELQNGRELIQIEILDLSGRVLLIKEAPGTKELVNVSTLAPGLYLLRAYDGKRSYNKQWIKQD